MKDYTYLGTIITNKWIKTIDWKKELLAPRAYCALLNWRVYKYSEQIQQSLWY